MEVDLYNRNLNLEIEIQGHQHNTGIKHFQTYKEWELKKERDLLKASILRTRNTRLLYVPSIKILPDEA